MGRLSEDYVKVYAGNRELIDRNAYIGDEPLGILHKCEYFPFKKWQYDVGDIIVYDKTKNIKRCIAVHRLSEIDPQDYIPIGVVAIPSSHDIYGTKEAGVVSLKGASLVTPDTGTISKYENLEFGFAGNCDFIPQINAISGLGFMSEQPTADITKSSVTGYLPSECLDGEVAQDGTKYSSDWNDYRNPVRIPSPYKKDGLRNLLYGDNKSFLENAISDFDGMANSQNVIPHITPEDWRVSEGLSKVEGKACASCWRYHTEGTLLGDWYLPALGELGYVCNRINTINNSIQAINDWNKSFNGLLIADNLNNFYYISSTCSGLLYDWPGMIPYDWVWYIGTSNGSVGGHYRRGYDNDKVRPFTRVKPNEF